MPSLHALLAVGSNKACCKAVVSGAGVDKCLLIPLTLLPQLQYYLFAYMQALLSLPGVQDLLEALVSYTQRHFVRIDRLVRSSFLLDYTLASMNVIMPEENMSQSVHKLSNTQASLQQSDECETEVVRAADDIQAVLAHQSMLPQLDSQQEEAPDAQQGALQQSADAAETDVAHAGHQVETKSSQKAKAAKAKRKSGSSHKTPHPVTNTTQKKTRVAA